MMYAICRWLVVTCSSFNDRAQQIHNENLRYLDTSEPEECRLLSKEVVDELTRPHGSSESDSGSDGEERDDVVSDSMHRQFELVLVVASTDMTSRQRKNLRTILDIAEENMESSKKRGRRKQPFLHPLTAESIVIQICDGGNQRIALARDEFVRCKAFKERVRKAVKRQTRSGSGDSSDKFPLPEFEISVISIRQSVKYSLGQARKGKAIFEERQSVLGMRQTRNAYNVHHSPMMKKIAGSNAGSQ